MNELILNEARGFVFGTLKKPSDNIFRKFIGEKDVKCVAKPEDKDGHILVVGGVGSGKSRGIAIPSLQAWRERVFVIDIKGELYKETAPFRDESKIELLDPTSVDPNAFGYDPFYFLNSNPKKRVQEAQKITLALLPTPADAREPFWIKSAQMLLTGAILHYSFQGLSFIDTLNEIQNTPVKELVNTIVASDLGSKAQLFVTQFHGMDDKVLAGIFSELSIGIVPLITDEDLINCFSKKKNIQASDLEKKDIYIKIPEHLLDQWENLLTLMVSQFLSYFERREDKQGEHILFLLDEFPRLGKMEKITNALSTLRSKNVTICLIVQSLAQLDRIYGKETRQVICDTCAYKAILSVADADVQDIFSRLIGTHEVKKEGRSQNFSSILERSTGTGKTQTLEEKRIIKPEELATIKEVILLAPTPPGFLRVRKIKYNENIFSLMEKTSKNSK